MPVRFCSTLNCFVTASSCPIKGSATTSESRLRRGQSVCGFLYPKVFPFCDCGRSTRTAQRPLQPAEYCRRSAAVPGGASDLLCLHTHSAFCRRSTMTMRSRRSQWPTPMRCRCFSRRCVRRPRRRGLGAWRCGPACCAAAWSTCPPASGEHPHVHIVG